MQIFKPSSFRSLKLAILLFISMSFYGLQAQISSTTIVVNTLSVAATGAVGTPAVFCTGSSATLSVEGGLLGTDAAWMWYADSCGTGALLGTGVSLTISPVNLTTNPMILSYFVRAEGICNITTCAQVSVIINPTPTFTVPLSATYCVGDLVLAQVMVGTPTGITFDIEGGADIGIADINGVLQIPAFTATNTTDVSITSTITVTPQALGCTGVPQTFTITVAPSVEIVPIVSQVLCNSTPTVGVTVTSNVGSGVTYDWTNSTPSIGLAASGSGNIASFTAINTSCVDVVATITVTPTVTEGTTTCVQAPVIFTFTVRPTPNGTLTSNNPICEGEQALITFTSTCGTGPFGLDIRQDGVMPAQGYIGIVSGVTFNVLPTPLTPGAHTFDLMIITDANGCIAE